MQETAIASTTEAVDGLVPQSRVIGWTQAHPRLVDVAVAAVPAVAGVAAALLTRTTDWPVTVACAAVSGVALLWRRSRPIGILVMVSVLASIGYSPQLGPVVAVAVFTVAARTSLPAAIGGYLLPVVMAMVGATVKTAFGLAGPAAETPSALGLGTTIVEPLALIALAAGGIARSRRQRGETLRELVAQRIENARAAERTRIAAEMHDVVGHSLTVMIALANGVAVGWRENPEQSAVALRHLSTVGSEALSDMQRTLRVLRGSDARLDDALHSSGYDVPPIERTIEVFRTAGLPVVFLRTGAALPADPILRLSVHRIIQEALTNALRYAVDPTRVEVAFAHDGDAIRVSVTDDGRAGHRESVGSGRGLVGIMERVTALGGASRAGPRRPRGWAVRATIPVSIEEPDD